MTEERQPGERWDRRRLLALAAGGALGAVAGRAVAEEAPAPAPRMMVAG